MVPGFISTDGNSVVSSSKFQVKIRCSVASHVKKKHEKNQLIFFSILRGASDAIICFDTWQLRIRMYRKLVRHQDKCVAVGRTRSS